jgi:uncharacterized protein (TIGR00255 family)
MTAFARAAAPVREGGWGVEIRSLNHRYFEFSVKLPPALNALENRIREQVQVSMRRGKITVAISQEGAGDPKNYLSIDEEAVKFYLTSLTKLKKKFKLQGELSVADVLKFPGLFSGENDTIDPDKIWPDLKKTLTKALDYALKAKQLEGQKLAKDIDARLAAVTKSVAAVEKHAAGQSGRVFNKLMERLQGLTSENNLDPDRMEREAAFLAERCDITEEIVRMKSHLDLFKKRLRGDGEVGRELDFLCQEMNREVNTMTSKAQHFDISTEVVFMKGELEKIREQIQNIE